MRNVARNIAWYIG